jgi:MFS family permease
MAHFHSASGPGVWQTFLVLAAIYFVFMAAGAFGYRVPPDYYHPAHIGRLETRTALAQRSVALEDAWKRPQFWLLWAVLCLNVSAGIGVLDMASPMLQEIFGGSLIGQPGLGYAALSPPQLKSIALIAAGFTGFLSLFNIIGRFFWASLSDRLGRRNTFSTFFILGIVLYALVPTLAAMGSKPLFALTFGVILSMYGGGFATVPAYLADIFGTGFVGAIHGRLLTAWSAAGVIGPILVTSLRQAQLDAGVARAKVYDHTMYILAVLLALGLVCNLLIRPVADRWFTRSEAVPSAAGITASTEATSGVSVPMILAWAAVGIPLAWGFYMTILKASSLFM